MSVPQHYDVVAPVQAVGFPVWMRDRQELGLRVCETLAADEAPLWALTNDEIGATFRAACARYAAPIAQAS